jgi:hypothetical protein
LPARRSTHSIGCPQPLTPAASTSSSLVLERSDGLGRASAFMHDGGISFCVEPTSPSVCVAPTQRGSSGLASKCDDRLIRSDALSNVTPTVSRSLVPPSPSGATGLGERAHSCMAGASPSASSQPSPSVCIAPTQRGSPGLASKCDDRLIRSDAPSNVTPTVSRSLVPPSPSGARGLAGTGRVCAPEGGI